MLEGHHDQRHHDQSTKQDLCQTVHFQVKQSDLDKCAQESEYNLFIINHKFAFIRGRCDVLKVPYVSGWRCSSHSAVLYRCKWPPRPLCLLVKNRHIEHLKNTEPLQWNNCIIYVLLLLPEAMTVLAHSVFSMLRLSLTGGSPSSYQVKHTYCPFFGNFIHVYVCNCASSLEQWNLLWWRCRWSCGCQCSALLHKCTIWSAGDPKRT